MEDLNLKGNVTTVVKLAVMFAAPYFSIAEATQNDIISLIVALIFLIVGYFDARYDSTIIKTANLQEVVEDEADTIGWHNNHQNCRCTTIPSELEDAVIETCREEDAINPEYNEGA